MDVILKPAELPFVLLRRDKYTAGSRRTRFAISLPVPDGTLLYHLLTGELLYLETYEAAAGTVCPDGDLPEPLSAYFAEHAFLVPPDTDETQLADDVHREMRKQQARRATGKIRMFTVLPTTVCNAGCFYCYEKGCRQQTMDDTVASDTAAYILKYGDRNGVRLRWFGGEPLLGAESIDRICAILEENKASYVSEMITNGSLLTEEMILRARSLWHLTGIQITLDGDKASYERIKAYHAPCTDGMYERVLNNIAMLTDAGIPTAIRLNMTGDNRRELEQACRDLRKQVRETDMLSVYPCAIYQLADDPERYADVRKETERLKQSIDALGLRRTGRECIYTGKGRVPLNQCIADDPDAVLIMPDGTLGRCEHFDEGPFFGSIYSSERNRTAYDYWTETTDPSEMCGECAFYPRCFRLKHCYLQRGGCTPGSKLGIREALEEEMMTAYQQWLNKKRTEGMADE